MSKSSKRAARYREYPNDGELCASCTMYIPPDGCTAVLGDVQPHGWCSFYERKRGRRAESPFAKSE